MAMNFVFEFETDNQSQAYCELIAHEMCALFGMPLEEAVLRINRHWQGQSIIGEHNLVYHRDENFWANQIYYEDDCSWWVPGSVLTPKTLD
jgi:hypothetical protein